MESTKKDLYGLSHLFVCVFLFHFSAFMVIPAITDVTMAALCPGKDECSLAIYLTGFHQAMTGLGTLMVTPLIGNLSDKYGRKALLTLPMTIGIVPIVILAYNQSRPFFYAYYCIKMFTGMLCDGSMQCLSLAFVADRVGEGRRASAFGVLSGVSAAGFLSGTVTARFLSTASIFQISAAVAMLAATYMRFFLTETSKETTLLYDTNQPLCSCPSDDNSSSPKLQPFRKVPSLHDMIHLLKSSLTLSRAAVVTFFISLGDSGLHASLLYFLKAQFHFNKDQFADLLLILGIAGALSQLLLMPSLATMITEEKLLSIGLLASCAHVFLYSISWASWVPYFASIFTVLSVFIHPCIRSTVSKQVGPDEQGMAQGCITGISSFANIISPFAFTPLTALFLSDNAPFNFKGFSIMCSGFASLIAFTLSIIMRATTPVPVSHRSFHDIRQEHV
ncbi:hippocampus abundant transcript-like protein 1 isoform X2 [Iris pallida]|uniref:Hippocampus abundant transcript-like protein 1 isoform X2 n=1 Tax=Iris pallida TaxID=29817 RepID=A0AAX6GIH0_IRIPA|nr:hippocampus abundant transcript-like protein 1 isoform X2 [Iris pallida]